MTIPFYRLVRAFLLCRGRHKKLPTWKRVAGVDNPAGFMCTRCGRHTDLNGRFDRWA